VEIGVLEATDFALEHVADPALQAAIGSEPDGILDEIMADVGVGNSGGGNSDFRHVRHACDRGKLASRERERHGHDTCFDYLGQLRLT
jgi:hypothetical protein